METYFEENSTFAPQVWAAKSGSIYTCVQSIRNLYLVIALLIYVVLEALTHIYTGTLKLIVLENELITQTDALNKQ